MPHYDADDFARWAPGVWHGSSPGVISGISIDSRSLQPGDLFVALKTDLQDGNDYVRDSKEKGASGAIVSRIVPDIELPQLLVADTLAALQEISLRWRLRFTGPVIAITGSCGKTSTKEILALVLGDEGIHRTQANENNMIGVPLTLLGIDREVHRFAVVEAGTDVPGEIALLARLIDPTHSLITGVSATHLESFGSIEKIAEEKSQLGRRTRAGGVVVFHSDGLRFDCFGNFRGRSTILVREGVPTQMAESCRRIIYWKEQANQAPAGGSRLTFRGASSRENSFDLRPCSPGMVENMALAIALATTLKIPDVDIQVGLESWRAAPLRGEERFIDEKSFYIDCYNASPASMADALAFFSCRVPIKMPRLYVLGCMAELGEDSAELHRQVGRLIRLREEDRVLLIGEKAGSIREGIIETGNRGEQITIMDSYEKARVILNGFKGAVLLKGSRVYGLEALLPKAESRRKYA
jgi:UDP-N-acetylmuramoyl-tripeptide--D-alanyl-D-alanine ligase